MKTAVIKEKRRTYGVPRRSVLIFYAAFQANEKGLSESKSLVLRLLCKLSCGILELKVVSMNYTYSEIKTSVIYFISRAVT